MKAEDQLNEILVKAFSPGQRLIANDFIYEISVHVLGDLALPTGKIVACDPLAARRNELCFTRAVKPGTYRLELSLATLLKKPGGRMRSLSAKNKSTYVACAKLVFDDTVASRWELAYTAEQDLKKLKPGEFFGYGVDSGHGCFLDEQVFQEFSEKFREEETQKKMLNSLYATNWGQAYAGIHTFVPGKQEALFSTFAGDGAYATYWGVSQRGDVVSLVTNFYGIPDDSDYFDLD